MTLYCKWKDKFCTYVDEETGMCGTRSGRCEYFNDFSKLSGKELNDYQNNRDFLNFQNFNDKILFT
jgi:hypothetical protein